MILLVKTKVKDQKNYNMLIDQNVKLIIKIIER